jgi:Oxidoreductase molybdopterin binding domain
MTTPQWPKPDDTPEAEGEQALQAIHGKTRRAFLWSTGAVGATVFSIYYTATRPVPDTDGIPTSLRKILGLNDKVSRALFRQERLSKEFPPEAAGELKPNGEYGLDADVDEASYKVLVRGLHDMSAATAQEGDEPAIELSLDTIKKLPSVTMVTEHKCIEGWSAVVQWKGVRLRDLIVKLGPATKSGAAPDPVQKPQDLLPYVGLETPDGQYYVGLDIESAMHPQTLLCYEMNGKPLTPKHGAPLRLATPIKYGVKSIKRVGVIRFTRDVPKDFWAERGYDWYAGL